MNNTTKIYYRTNSNLISKQELRAMMAVCTLIGRMAGHKGSVELTSNWGFEVR